MAKIKYGDTIVAGSGKINGHVLAKNRYGAYMRTKVTPTNPKTSAQVAQRARLAEFAQKWRTLTEEQRSAWNGAVDSYKGTNIFGDVTTPTGNVCFTKVNINIKTAGGTEVQLPPMPQGVTSPSAVSFTADKTAGTLEVVFGPTPVPAGMTLVIEATNQMSPGISNANNKFRVVQVVAAAGSSPVDIFTAYTTKFGSLVVGMKLQVRIKFINKTTGEVSQSLNAVGIVE